MLEALKDILAGFIIVALVLGFLGFLLFTEIGPILFFCVMFIITCWILGGLYRNFEG